MIYILVTLVTFFRWPQILVEVYSENRLLEIVGMLVFSVGMLWGGDESSGIRCVYDPVGP